MSINPVPVRRRLHAFSSYLGRHTLNTCPGTEEKDVRVSFTRKGVEDMDSVGSQDKHHPCHLWPSGQRDPCADHWVAALACQLCLCRRHCLTPPRYMLRQVKTEPQFCSLKTRDNIKERTGIRGKRPVPLSRS